MARHQLTRCESDSRTKIGRDAPPDDVPIADEPGFYEPGRSPSLLLANWFWLRHIIRALRYGSYEPLRALGRLGQRLGARGREIGMSMAAKWRSRPLLARKRRSV